MKNCYRCGKELTVKDVVEAHIQYETLLHEEAVEEDIHCVGEDSEFILDTDTEIINELKNRLGVEDDYVDRVVYCEACVNASKL